MHNQVKPVGIELAYSKISFIAGCMRSCWDVWAGRANTAVNGWQASRQCNQQRIGGSMHAHVYAAVVGFRQCGGGQGCLSEECWCVGVPSLLWI